jgi:hypothetical protein
MKIQENHERMKLNVTRQFLVDADGVNLLRSNMNTLKKKTEDLSVAAKCNSEDRNTNKAVNVLRKEHRTNL